MKILQTTRKHLTILGIEPKQSTGIFSLNWRLLLGFSLFADAIISTTLFLVYLANDIMDYILCFCVISALIELCFCFSLFVFQRQRLFNYIESMEKLINQSKFYIPAFSPFDARRLVVKYAFVSGLKNLTSKAIHVATDRQQEKISRFLYVAMGKIAPHLIIWPKCIVCFAIYFTSDLGDAAFQLPIPVW